MLALSPKSNLEIIMHTRVKAIYKVLSEIYSKVLNPSISPSTRLFSVSVELTMIAYLGGTSHISQNT
jgi:hypothetical protein